MPSLHTLEVRFPFELGGGHVSLYAVVPYISEQPRVDGRVAKWLVPPGEYAVLHYRAGEMQVVVSGDTRVDFAGILPDRLRITILDEHGYLARLGLRSGDAIVAINGQELRGYVNLRETRDRIKNGAQATLLVERDGVLITIELQPEKQEEPGKIGGRLEYGRIRY